MEKTEEKEFKNSRERIKEHFENIIKGYKNLWEIIEKLCATELPDHLNSNVPLKDDTTIFNKEIEIEMKPDTLTASETNTIDSEILKSSRNFSDDTETLVSTLQREEDVADEISLDYMSEKSGSTDILLDWGSNTPSPRTTPDIASELCDSPKKKLFQSVQKHSIHDDTGDITETSMPHAEDSEVAAVFFTAEEVREAIQQALIPLSGPEKSFEDFLSSHSLNTFRDLNTLESETKFSSSDLTHSPVGQLKNPGQRSNNLFQLPDFAWKPDITAEENSCSDADFNNNAITDDEKISSIDLEWKYHLKTLDTVSDHLKALEDFISRKNSERHECLRPSASDLEPFLSGLQFQVENFSLKSPNKNHQIAVKMQNIKNLNNNEFPNIDHQSTVSSQPSLKINIITDDNQESDINSDATGFKDSPCISTTTGEDWGNLSLAKKRKKDRRKLKYEFLTECYHNVFKDSPFNSTTTGEDWGNLSLAEKHKKDRNKLLNEFLSGSYLNESQIRHCDWKLTDSDQDIKIDKKSRQVLKMLNFLQEYMIENNLSPSEINTIYEDVVSPSGSPDICSTFEKGTRPITSSTDDGHPDTLTDIFKTVLKCHPLKKFEIPPYASDNPDGMVGTAESRVDDSCNELTPNRMQLRKILENPPILGESTNIDSDSLIVFEIKDCFSENSSIICDALVKEYVNIAVKLNIFFLKKAQDVSLEEYEKRMDNLHCLDDELGYLSAKLITVKNDWIKQSEEIDRNLRNNSLMIKSSKGLYHKSILKTCREVIRILLRFCFQKQLELENYENELVIKHGSNG